MIPSDFKPGDIVKVEIEEPGPGGKYRRVAGTLLCIVIHSGIECDVMIHPAEDMVYADDVLRRCDVSIDDLWEGPVIMLRNCQSEDLTLIHRLSLFDRMENV